MNILIAPNSMKGSLSAFEFAETVEKAFLDSSPDFSTRKIPVADGGDNTGAVLRRAFVAREVSTGVADPLGRKIQAKYGKAGKTVIIEMADASGLKLLTEEERDPLKTSTFGTGQLIKHALENGCKKILLGVGGSATVDGGIGMMEALGVRFYSKNNKPVPGKASELANIYRIEKPVFSGNASIKIISDVDNKLLGPRGAAAVFGPQKGASPETVEVLENGLSSWCSLLETVACHDLRNLNGVGAAGGIALPLLTFFNAEIVAGARFILSKLNFSEHLNWADIVITGEGKIDTQTLNEKAPYAVAKAAREKQKPVIAIAGKVEAGASQAFDGIFSFANGPVPPEKSMEEAKILLYDFSFQFARLLKTFGKPAF